MTTAAAAPARRVRLRLAASRIPVPITALTPGETQLLAALPGAPRRRSWLIARHALRRALVSAGLPADTSACTFPGRRASLSYAGDAAVAAVVTGDPADVVGVGIDVEVDNPPSEAAAGLYLNEPECAWLATVPSQARPGTLLRLWTVKEALFKAHPANAGSTLRRYALPEPGAWRGIARYADTASTSSYYLTFQLQRGYLSVAVTLISNGVRGNG